MASYRLIDEMPGTRQRKAPFSPLGLYFLTWLALPVAVPFWIINWGRLGHPEKRLIAALAGVAAFGLPILLYTMPSVSPSTYRFCKTLAMFAFSYFQLYGQRPLYELQLARGGKKAPAWPLWLAAGLTIVWVIGTVALRKS
ncbi:hypothetical protein EON80_16920 [bacterium]|nr:MAG: hypothetical protein EON80_16920 [bacterium]